MDEMSTAQTALFQCGVNVSWGSWIWTQENNIDDTGVVMMKKFILSLIIRPEEQVSTAVRTMPGDEEAGSEIAVGTASLHGCESFYS